MRTAVTLESTVFRQQQYFIQIFDIYIKPEAICMKKNRLLRYYLKIHLFIPSDKATYVFTLFFRQNEGLYIDNVVTGRSLGSSLLFDYCLCRRCAGNFY